MTAAILALMLVTSPLDRLSKDQLWEMLRNADARVADLEGDLLECQTGLRARTSSVVVKLACAPIPACPPCPDSGGLFHDLGLIVGGAAAAGAVCAVSK